MSTGLRGWYTRRATRWCESGLGERGMEPLPATEDGVHLPRDQQVMSSALFGRLDHEAADELLHVGSTTGRTLDIPRLPIAQGEG
jgi:hypothetical protein